MKIFTRPPDEWWTAPHINKMAILRKNNNDPPFLFKNYKKKIDLVVKYRKNNGKQSRGHIIFLI